MNRIINDNNQKEFYVLPNDSDCYLEQQETRSKQKTIWINEFAGDINALELPLDFARPSIKGYHSNSLKIELSPEETQKLKVISYEEGTSMYILLLSVFNIFISKLSNQEDIIVGAPFAVSKIENAEDTTEGYINTLPLRNYPKGELGFREFLSTLKVRTLTSLNNKSYPYENLIKELKLDPDISRNPLFDVMFLYQDMDELEYGVPTLDFHPHSRRNDITKFNLTLSVDLSLLATEANGKLFLTLEYSTELF